MKVKSSFKCERMSVLQNSLCDTSGSFSRSHASPAPGSYTCVSAGWRAVQRVWGATHWDKLREQPRPLHAECTGYARTFTESSSYTSGLRAARPSTSILCAQLPPRSVDITLLR